MPFLLQSRRFLAENRKALLLGVALFSLIAVQSGALFFQSRAAMEQQLKLRLQTAAALAAQRFTGEELDLIHVRSDMQTALYRSLSVRLRNIRSTVPNIDYAYILRRTGDPLTLEFVADADSFMAVEEADKNENGIVDPEEEPSYPGDSYGIDTISALQGPAFEGPTTDHEVTVDQWGEMISGYAPIFRSDGLVAAVIGLDMDASSYLADSQKAFSLLALLTLVSIGIISVFSIAYITWERRAEAYRMIENERSSMLALATHQMGGPIATIRWWLEVMQDSGICDKEKACAEIETASRKLNDILRALIDVERQEHSKVAYEPRTSRVRDLVQKAVAESSAKVGKAHTINVNIAEHLSVNLDQTLIGGVINELLENAMTYSEKGSLIEVSALRRGGAVEIAIRDSGCGIPSDEIAHVFEKLRRGKEAYRYKPNGNGLGLYTARLIVERAGGSIRVTSEQGKGSTFTIRLPVS